jgi:cysteinyl-tRNA synthetase
MVRCITMLFLQKHQNSFIVLRKRRKKMQIHNTKTRKKEVFKPLSDREVKVYYCGPTVYNYAHIGNLRTYVFEDVVIKTLKFL